MLHAMTGDANALTRRWLFALSAVIAAITGFGCGEKDPWTEKDERALYAACMEHFRASPAEGLGRDCRCVVARAVRTEDSKDFRENLEENGAEEVQEDIDRLFVESCS